MSCPACAAVKNAKRGGGIYTHLSEGTADLSEVVLGDILVQVSDVQLEACQCSGVAEDNVPLPGVLGLLFLLASNVCMYTQETTGHIR